MKRLLAQVSWVFFDRIFRLATGMIVSIWLARYLGPAQYGTLNYAIVFPLLLSALASLGINNLLFTEIPISPTPAQTNQLMVTAVLLRLIAGTLAFGLIMLVNTILHRDQPTIWLLITLSAVMLVVQGLDAIDVYFLSIRKVYYAILPKVGAFLLGTAARFWGLTHQADLSFFLLVSLLELTAGCVVVWLLYLRYQKRPLVSQSTGHFASWPINTDLAQRLLRLSWPLMLSEFFIFIYSRLDQIMLESMAGAAELGRYSAALRLSETWYFAGAALTTALYPAIIERRAIDYADYLRRYRLLLATLAGLGIGLGIVMSLLANPLTHLVYGSQYAGVETIVRIHIWTGAFVFLGVGVSNWFVVEGQQQFLMGRTFAGAILNIGLNLFLIPTYGAVGASVATLVSQIVASYLIHGLFAKTKEVFQLQTGALLFVPIWLVSFVGRATSAED